MLLILSVENSVIPYWYIYGSYAVYHNMIGSTGRGLTMGLVFPILASIKQKLNTRSSTESEIVGVDQLIPSALWTRYFSESQGCGVTDNISYQYNESTILLEKTSKSLSIKHAKHTNTSYFSVTNSIHKGEISVEWCPMGEITGDFLSI